MFTRFAVFSAAALTLFSPLAVFSSQAQAPVVVTPTFSVGHAFFVQFRPRGHMPLASIRSLRQPTPRSPRSQQSAGAGVSRPRGQ